jgi:hypothetical protein
VFKVWRVEAQAEIKHATKTVISSLKFTIIPLLGLPNAGSGATNQSVIFAKIGARVIGTNDAAVGCRLEPFVMNYGRILIALPCK